MTTTPAAPTKQELIKSLLTYSKAKLNQAKTEREPFPYLTVEKLLPSRMMDSINKFYPTLEQMESMPEKRTGNPYAHEYRRLFPLNEQTLTKLNKEQRRYWKIFSVYMQVLGPKLLRALPEPPEGQQFRTAEPSEIKTRIDLWSDRGGYQITPHTDAPHKLATFLLYCTADASLAAEGTVIYRPRDRDMRCWTGRQLPYDQFDEVFRSPYAANRLFGFRKTDQSFHGKPPVGELQTERRVIAITVQTSDSFVQ